MRCKSLILPDFSNSLTLADSLSNPDKGTLLKNIRSTLVVFALALSLAGISNTSFARVQSDVVKQQSAKSKTNSKTELHSFSARHLVKSILNKALPS